MSHDRTYSKVTKMECDYLVVNTSAAFPGGADVSSGDLTIDAGDLVFTKTSAHIVPGATSILIQNNADNATNILITDAGAVTIRAGLTITAGGLVVTAGGLTVTADGLTVTAGGLTVTAGGITSNAGAIAFTGSGAKVTLTSANAAALAVGPAGATNPSLLVDASTATAATGLSIKSAAAAGGVAVAAISSGTDEPMTVDAKGSGTVTLNGTGTGNVIVGTALAFGTDASAAKTIVAGTTNGLKIGTGATQKLGFFGTAPAVQPTKAGHNNWAAAADVASALADLGLVDTA
jgi:hypothetical protein